MRTLVTAAIAIGVLGVIGVWWSTRRQLTKLGPVTRQWRHDHAYDRDGDDSQG